MNNETLLHEKIKSDFETLKELEVGSGAYTATVDGVAKLMDRAIEIDKLNADQQLKQKQLDEDRVDRIVKNCLTAVSVIGGFAMTYWGAKNSWKFEETGTITSTPGRKFINNLFKW